MQTRDGATWFALNRGGILRMSGGRQEYFDWARAVIDRLRGVHPSLEAIFDEAYARRPQHGDCE